MKEINIYTDGSCRRNTKTGAYGFIVVKDEEIIERFVKKVENTTNQRMEMCAILSAYEYCEKNNITKGQILSDSSYCLNCALEKWYIKWENNGFISSKGNNVKNKDLWEKIIPFYKKSSIILKKVPGHRDCYFNNFIDSLVVTMSSSKTEDLTGKKFGKLQVLQLWGNYFTNNQHTTFWKCKCECGNEAIVAHTNLHSKQTTSCGECNKQNHKDLTNSLFGFLEPLNYVGVSNDHYALWKCKCHNCGNNTIVSSRALKQGQISCGCIKSKGETKISKILNEHNINFIREYKFNDLIDKKSLKFDFAIFKNNKLYCLIEYQGIQHFKTSTGWSTKEHLELTQYHDNMKREYCEKNGIKMIEIPYTDYDKIDWNYLKEKID